MTNMNKPFQSNPPSARTSAYLQGDARFAKPSGGADFDLLALRAEFPMLTQRGASGRPLIYFNNAATSLKPRSVIASMSDYYQHYGVTVFRGVDSISYRATESFESVRRSCADFLNASDASEIVFTRNTTDALNLVASSFGPLVAKAGSEVVVSLAEHHANFIPWQQLCLRTGAKLVLAPIDANGVVTAAALESVMSGRTVLVALNHMSNVMGGENKLRELAAVAHKHGAVFVADGAQGILHRPADVRAWDVDFYAFSGHKLFGPTGIGVLYGKREYLQAMPPIMFGGEMIDRVTVERTTFADPPHRFEAGTPMIAEVIGLGAALDFLKAVGYERIQRQVGRLGKKLRDGLALRSDIKLYNPANCASGIVSFNVIGVHAHDAASVFDRADISLRAGHHCNQTTMHWLSAEAVLRASLAVFNTDAEVDAFIQTAGKAGDFLDALF